jgi:hypothetical protein
VVLGLTETKGHLSFSQSLQCVFIFFQETYLWIEYIHIVLLCQDRFLILLDLFSQNSWSESVWGMKDNWKGPYDIKAMVVISLSHLI